MDHQSLVYIAQVASIQALNYHLLIAECNCGSPDLDQETKVKLSDKIKLFLPIAQKSQNKSAAYLEVVCDAAVVVAEKYNINKRWFYTAVQGLASMALVPNMYKDAGDPVSLGPDHLRLYEDSENEAPKKNGLVWTKPEVQEVIDRKIAGEAIPAIAEHVGRSVSSIKNQWRLVARPNSGWKDYIEKKMGEVEGGLDGEDEQSDESNDSDENDEDDEDEEAHEANEQTQPPDPSTNTDAAANSPVATDPTRPWTDPDIRDLIKYKVEGLSNFAIVNRMHRANNSIHCTWANLWNSTNGRWFSYIHKQFRAKRRREKQEKASHELNNGLATVQAPVTTTTFPLREKKSLRLEEASGDTGAGVDLTGQSESVSLS